MSIRILPPARIEVQEAFAYYRAISADVAHAFAQEFRAAIHGIGEAPNAWTPFKEQYRKKNLRRFPYGIAYHVDGADIIVVAFINLNRDLKRWDERWKRT